MQNAEIQAQITALLAENSALKKELAKRDKTLQKKEEIIQEQRLFIDAVSMRDQWLIRQIFLSKRERLEDPAANPQQLKLELGLIEQEDTDKPADAEPEANKEQAQKPRQKRPNHKGRNPLPDHLERVEIRIKPENLTDEMVKVGEEVTEVLCKVPAQCFVKRIIREKYMLKSEVEPDTASFSIAPMPEQFFPKSFADESLLAWLATAKYVDHLPLYRLRQILKRDGVYLSDSTLSHWINRMAAELEPIYEALKRSVTQHCAYLQMDESRIQVVDRRKKGKTHRGYMWVMLDAGDKSVLFSYQKGRSKQYPKELLSEFRGLLQTDGYAAYDQFEENPEIHLLGCMAHARRKFFNARKQDKKRAAHFLKEVKKLYLLEDHLKELEQQDQEQQLAQGFEVQIDLERRADFRQEKALPILNGLREWLIEEQKAVLPKSAIGKAISYSLARWDKLTGYVHHPIAQIDNNLIENQIRPLALGRKNYLFAGSHDAAQNAAIFYSLFASAKLNGLNPYQYLYTILKRIPTAKVSQIDNLLPYNFSSSEDEYQAYTFPNID